MRRKGLRWPDSARHAQRQEASQLFSAAVGFCVVSLSLCRPAAATTSSRLLRVDGVKMLLPLRCALSSLTVSIPSCCLAAAAAAAPLFLSGSHAAGFVDHRPAVGRVGREPFPVQHRPEAVEHLHDRCHGRCDYCWCASRTATATTATFEPLAAARTRACVPTRVYKSLLLGGSLHRACRSRCLSSAAVAHHLPASFCCFSSSLLLRHRVRHVHELPLVLVEQGQAVEGHQEQLQGGVSLRIS